MHPTPRHIYALWNNFRTLAAKNNWTPPNTPLYFLKSPSSLAAHNQSVIKPASYTGRVFYEGELGVVIGKTGKNIAREAAAEHVRGYCCVNDVTALELLREDASFEQWVRAKSFDTFTPVSTVSTAITDPSQLIVRTVVNGRERQHYPVSDMFFSPLDLVSLLSRDVTLQEGDLISCGTSIGSMPWQVGATVEVIIEGVGTLSNVLVEGSA
jgi:2-keto-4-pentenoate hydratase/2-oxohepta-3-ene-1,7-dioic acid hydratase in catechol pathway